MPELAHAARASSSAARSDARGAASGPGEASSAASVFSSASVARASRASSAYVASAATRAPPGVRERIQPIPDVLARREGGVPVALVRHRGVAHRESREGAKTNAGTSEARATDRFHTAASAAVRSSIAFGPEKLTILMMMLT